jgi:hypothetical protein
VCAVYTACSSQKLWAKIESLRERHDSSEMFLSWQYRVPLGAKTTTPSCVPKYTARSSRCSQNVLAERKGLRERHQMVLQRWQIQGAGGCKNVHAIVSAFVHVCMQPETESHTVGRKREPERQARSVVVELTNTGCHWAQTLVCGGDLHTPSRVPVCTARSN